MSLIKCSECGQTVSDKAAACIHCGAPIKLASGHRQVEKKRKNRLLTAIEIGLFVALGIAMLPHLFSGDPNTGDGNPATRLEPAASTARPHDLIGTQDDTTGETQRTTPPEVVAVNVAHAPERTLASEMPAAEAQFVQILTAARAASLSAANDMQRGGIKATANARICSALAAGEVSRWVGTIKSLSANGDGMGVLAISLSPAATLTTNNNSFSDMDSHTLIPQNSTLFAEASALKEGDRVWFSGSFLRPDSGGSGCIDEGSLTLRGSIEDPEFIFRFSSIGVLGAAAAQPSVRGNVRGNYPSSLAPQPKMRNAMGTKPDPSFDCAKARYEDEKTICANTGLAAADVQMAADYQQAYRLALPSASVAAQRNWLKTRRTCQHDVPCLYRAYAERIP